MLIYAEKISPRLQYIAETIFGECSFTTDAVAFFEAATPKINYSHKRFSGKEFHINPYGLLNETIIKKQSILINEWRGRKVFFTTKGDIPFDIFSAAFYLLSRYEEYLPHEKDSYGRFSHEESLAYREGFLNKPLLNEWVQSFFRLLEEKFKGYRSPVSAFHFIPTYDIDIAYAGGRGLLRSIIKLLKKEVTTINGKDIFDVYDWLDALHHQYRLQPVYFFLLAKYRSKYDRNLSPKSKALQQLIKHISADAETGIHPSWQSFYDADALKSEVRSLQKILQKKVTASRQHYIQFTLPVTYRELVQAGVTDEYSMGYGSINGFRASYASSFYWYDLMKEEKTGLLLHPFCYMEANSFFEQQLSAEEAAEELQYYFDTVKNVNGTLITIFHNHFLTEQKEWLPWRKMYSEFLAANFSKTVITSPSPQEQ